MKANKKIARHRIDFEDAADLEAVVLAKLGFGNACIQQHAALSDGQIQYRLNKAKHLEGLPHGEGYRRQWREGKSPLARDVMEFMVPSVRKEMGKVLPALITHPTPETVKEVDLQAPAGRNEERRPSRKANAI